MNNNTNEVMSDTSAAPRSNWVAITVAVIGGALLLGAMGTAAVAGIYASTRSGGGEAQHLTSSAEGVTSLSVEAVAARFVITCEGAVDRPGTFDLTTDSGDRQWRMFERGGHLRVEPNEPWIGASFGGSQRVQDITLGLPAEACDGSSVLNADVELGAGKLLIDGSYGEFEALVEAGDFEFTGDADAFDLELAAGSADFVANNVREAQVTVSAGKVKGEFAGSAPALLEAEVNAGRAVLTLPDELYSIRSDVSAGSFDNALRTEQGVTGHEVKVDVSAGHLGLKPRTAL
ncbi:hypothetical protein QBL02_10115 [Leucobacter sp. UT-8R-CII-1-4]|uniref:hypothetical protein n=1 Tax=Leucobacter sp. UT-8R-CII-1-4 TaxID=3040075 RepID=UPI0024A7AC5E|nr:hypothetical protein [Leucobacter sp. UT-8R-CII-1-4]MDI6023897.1 hypothetical protein [Leucobacter sp. UT-8R-CII-1-4]